MKPSCVRAINHIVGIVVALALLGCEGPITSTGPNAPIILATIAAKGYDIPSRMAVNKNTGNVYLTLSSSIMVLKGSGVAANITTAQVWAEGIAIDEVDNLVYVVNVYSGSISVIHGVELLANVVTPGIDPNDMTVDPITHLAYAVSGFNQRPNRSKDKLESNVLLLNGTSVVANLSFAGVLFTNVIADAKGYVYAGDRHGTIVVVKDSKEVARYEGVSIGGISPSIVDMVVNPRTNEVFVLDAFESIRKFQDGKLLELQRIPVEQNKTYSHMRIHPQTGKIYLLNRGTNEVVIVDSWKPVAHIPVGQRANQMEIDPFTGNVYVTSASDGMVTVINGTNVINTIRAGDGAIGINPNNGWVYVSDTAKQTVTVLGYPAASDNFFPTRNLTTVPGSASPTKPYP